MKFSKYIKDKLIFISTYLFIVFLIFSLLIAFKTTSSLIIIILILQILFLIITIGTDFYRKKIFYDNLLNNINLLDKKYLVLETLEKPNFYEGRLLYNVLYDINKSMNENVKVHELATLNFKEYIEMWIHEIKIPISSLTLISYNNKKDINKKILKQIIKIDNYIEQVLYYVRSENAEKDYLIKNNQLSKIINKVALKNKDDLLDNKIDFIVYDINNKVLTDSKWLEFILNQIINNSIKFCDKKKENKYIKITSSLKDDSVILNIYDNGIGISKQDLPRVFEKSFTGSNGRINNKATGIGLYIVKNLCEKLGHNIVIESESNKYTLVKITFNKTDYYDVLK